MHLLPLWATRARVQPQTSRTSRDVVGTALSSTSSHSSCHRGVGPHASEQSPTNITSVLARSHWRSFWCPSIRRGCSPPLKSAVKTLRKIFVAYA